MVKLECPTCGLRIDVDADTAAVAEALAIDLATCNGTEDEPHEPATLVERER